MDFRLEAIEQSLRDSAVESEKRAATSETLVDTLSSLKDEMSEKFGAVTSKVDNLNEILKHSESGGTEKFNKVEANFNALQTALRDIQTDNSRKIERVVEDTRNSKDLLTWLESKIKESKVEYTGKVSSLRSVQARICSGGVSRYTRSHTSPESRGGSTSPSSWRWKRTPPG